MADDTVHPFRIDVPQDQLDDLADRLTRTRLPAPLPGDGWDTGVPVAYLREIVDHWRDAYDWRAAEAELNAHPQFTTEIDGQNVHFLHVRSPEPDALPLLLTHGWPGSVAEFLDVIGPLADPRSHGGDPADAFHLVIPSLPGFGFSGPVADTGWTTGRIAAAWDELMRRLGIRPLRHAGRRHRCRRVTRGGSGRAGPGGRRARQRFRRRADARAGRRREGDADRRRAGPGRPGRGVHGTRSSATSRSSPPGRRRWPRDWSTRRPASSPGSWTSSASGPGPAQRRRTR